MHKPEILSQKLFFVQISKFFLDNGDRISGSEFYIVMIELPVKPRELYNLAFRLAKKLLYDDSFSYLSTSFGLYCLESADSYPKFYI